LGASEIDPKFECFDDAPGSADAPLLRARFVNYNCIVYPTATIVRPAGARAWSGRVTLRSASHPSDGLDRDGFRICRYSADYDNDKTISNAEHPRDYFQVISSLTRQNLLVIREDPSCPTAGAVDPAHGIFVDYSTVEQQPDARATPTPPSGP
jgi:hypothetical protein